MRFSTVYRDYEILPNNSNNYYMMLLNLIYLKMLNLLLFFNRTVYLFRETLNVYQNALLRLLD